jgi:hypothetical protein
MTFTTACATIQLAPRLGGTLGRARAVRSHRRSWLRPQYPLLPHRQCAMAMGRGPMSCAGALLMALSAASALEAAPPLHTMEGAPGSLFRFQYKGTAHGVGTVSELLLRLGRQARIPLCSTRESKVGLSGFSSSTLPLRAFCSLLKRARFACLLRTCSPCLMPAGSQRC